MACCLVMCPSRGPFNKACHPASRRQARSRPRVAPWVVKGWPRWWDRCGSVPPERRRLTVVLGRPRAVAVARWLPFLRSSCRTWSACFSLEPDLRHTHRTRSDRTHFPHEGGQITPKTFGHLSDKFTAGAHQL